MKRADADWNAVKRGTVQHERFEVTLRSRSEAIEIAVSCRMDDKKCKDSIAYGLIFSLEVAQESALPIYEETRALIADMHKEQMVVRVRGRRCLVQFKREIEDACGFQSTLLWNAQCYSHWAFFTRRMENDVRKLLVDHLLRLQSLKISLSGKHPRVPNRI